MFVPSLILGGLHFLIRDLLPMIIALVFWMFIVSLFLEHHSYSLVISSCIFATVVRVLLPDK